MHILSDWTAREFESVSDAVLLDMCEGGLGLEPTMLVKSSTLNLKHVVKSGLALVLDFSHDKQVRYTLVVQDDPEDPLQLWSEAQRPQETEALKRIQCGDSLVTFLFNEWSVPIAWAVLDVPRPSVERRAVVKLALVPQVEWQFVPSHMYLGDQARLVLDARSPDEGQQQEILARWIAGRLGRGVGVTPSPSFEKGGRVKEITDVLVSWDGGALAIESKALAVLNGALPSRSVLTKRTAKHVLAASKQLGGAVRALRMTGRIPACSGPDGTPALGSELIHATVLVSDLSLLTRASVPADEDIRERASSLGYCLHIMDPAELVRLIQASAYYADRDSVPAGAVLDTLLMRRFEVTLRRGPLVSGLYVT